MISGDNMSSSRTKKRKAPVAFAVGTGRCGTKCLAELMGAIDKVASFHELDPLNETFHRFSKWYDLPIDDEGFLVQKRQEVEMLAGAEDLFFESSAYLSLSIDTLFQEFDSRFVLMVRHPEAVANSYKRKGWYEKSVFSSNEDLIPGYQPQKQFHHYLGRTLPKDMSVQNWNTLSVVGRLGWYWSTLNNMVLMALERLPADRYKVQKLEDLNYDSFCELSAFLGATHHIDPERFDEICDSRPNSFSDLPKTKNWTEKERQEFLTFTNELANFFDYSLDHICP